MKKPNAVMCTKRPTTIEEVRGMVCNPIYAGVGAYPALVSDETWVGAAKQAIKEDGEEQFLVNMLYVLRQSMSE